MKTKTAQKSYDEVMALPRTKHKKPEKTNIFFRTLLRLVSIPDLMATHFSVRKIGTVYRSRTSSIHRIEGSLVRKNCVILNTSSGSKATLSFTCRQHSPQPVQVKHT